MIMSIYVPVGFSTYHNYASGRGADKYRLQKLGQVKMTQEVGLKGGLIAIRRQLERVGKYSSIQHQDM